jgi:hypothetical protein
MDEFECMRRVLTLRFGLDGESPQTLEEVGTRLGITGERVREIEAQALREPRLVVVRQGGVPQVTQVLIDPATDAAYYLGFDLFLVRAQVAEGEIVEMAGSRVVELDREEIQLAARYAAIKLALPTAWLRNNGAWWQPALDEARLTAVELAREAGLSSPPKLERSEIRELDLARLS